MSSRESLEKHAAAMRARSETLRRREAALRSHSGRSGGISVTAEVILLLLQTPKGLGRKSLCRKLNISDAWLRKLLSELRGAGHEVTI